ncbi:MAG: glutathione S-transferase [Paraglaciecola psychrophila]|jgi:glutathione S-transferase
MELIAVVSGLIVLEYFILTMLVGRARGKSGIEAPAMTGDPGLERALRVQLNTLEQLIIVLPGLWLFGTYISATWGAGLGLVFIVGRALYAQAYMSDPSRRGPGFLIGLLATVALLLGGIYGAVMAAL